MELTGSKSKTCPQNAQHIAVFAPKVVAPSAALTRDNLVRAVTRPHLHSIAGLNLIGAPATERDVHSRLKKQGAPNDSLVRPPDRHSRLFCRPDRRICALSRVRMTDANRRGDPASGVFTSNFHVQRLSVGADRGGGKWHGPHRAFGTCSVGRRSLG